MALSFARAVLARWGAPAASGEPVARKPLTDEQRRQMWRTSSFRGTGGQLDWFVEGTRAAEQYHGIKP
ncbi:hypothetical protein [Paracidovorax avenae]|uniref:hypothetical protein n=1 Tax=Paracidovorax avenae TaxID=80867 RepID=UPI0013147323|nr:hypothetical protein [Paracidovorax avenae]